MEQGTVLIDMRVLTDGKDPLSHILERSFDGKGFVEQTYADTGKKYAEGNVWETPDVLQEKLYQRAEKFVTTKPKDLIRIGKRIPIRPGARALIQKLLQHPGVENVQVFSSGPEPFAHEVGKRLGLSERQVSATRVTFPEGRYHGNMKAPAKEDIVTGKYVTNRLLALHGRKSPNHIIIGDSINDVPGMKLIAETEGLVIAVGKDALLKEALWRKGNIPHTKVAGFGASGLLHTVVDAYLQGGHADVERVINKPRIWHRRPRIRIPKSRFSFLFPQSRRKK